PSGALTSCLEPTGAKMEEASCVRDLTANEGGLGYDDCAAGLLCSALGGLGTTEHDHVDGTRPRVRQRRVAAVHGRGLASCEPKPSLPRCAALRIGVDDESAHHVPGSGRLGRGNRSPLRNPARACAPRPCRYRTAATAWWCVGST